MALKISLKPHERIVIGNAVITNSDTRTNILVENKIPILRQKDIINEEEANTPCRRIYFAIQLMYIDEDGLAKHNQRYWTLVKDLVQAAPSALPQIDRINEHIISGRYYQALKLAQKLIQYEQEVMSRA